MKNENSAFEKIPKNPFQISDLLRFGLNLENRNLPIYKSNCTDKMTILCLQSENFIAFFKVVLEKIPNDSFQIPDLPNFSQNLEAINIFGNIS